MRRKNSTGLFRMFSVQLVEKTPTTHTLRLYIYNGSDGEVRASSIGFMLSTGQQSAAFNQPHNLPPQTLVTVEITLGTATPDTKIGNFVLNNTVPVQGTIQRGRSSYFNWKAIP